MVKVISLRFIFVPLLLISLLAPPIEGDDALIVSTCNKTPNYNLCVGTLRANPRSVAADIAGLSLIMVEAVKFEFAAASTGVRRLIKKSPGLERPLNGCLESYETAIKYDLPVAVEALAKGDPKFAENGVADAAVEAEICEQGFGKSKSPITASNTALHDISEVARAVIRNLL